MQRYPFLKFLLDEFVVPGVREDLDRARKKRSRRKPECGGWNAWLPRLLELGVPIATLFATLWVGWSANSIQVKIAQAVNDPGIYRCVIHLAPVVKDMLEQGVSDPRQWLKRYGESRLQGFTKGNLSVMVNPADGTFDVVASQDAYGQASPQDWPRMFPLCLGLFFSRQITWSSKWFADNVEKLPLLVLKLSNSQDGTDEKTFYLEQDFWRKIKSRLEEKGGSGGESLMQQLTHGVAIEVTNLLQETLQKQDSIPTQHVVIETYLRDSALRGGREGALDSKR